MCIFSKSSHSSECSATVFGSAIRSLALGFLLFFLLGVFAPSAFAVEIVVDYSLDTQNWFGAGHPMGSAVGALARESLDLAASELSRILTDELTSVETPPTFRSRLGGEVNWFQSQVFTNPSTGATVQRQDAYVPAGELRVYAGVRDLSGESVALGEIGGGGWGRSFSVGEFSQSALNEVDEITLDFFNTAIRRGQPDGFVGWGGTVAFDPDVNWFYDIRQPVRSGTTDLFSTSLHELAHVLGFGTSTEWESLVSERSFFTGENSVERFGGEIPLDPNQSNWGENTFGKLGDLFQEAAMDPSLMEGRRKLFTNLDAAGLADIGWTIDWAIVEPFNFPCNLDGDQDCDLSDLTIHLSAGASPHAWLSDASSANGIDYVFGDLNLDGKINSTDMGTLLNNFGEEGEFGYDGGDLSLDGVVNAADLALMLNNIARASGSNVESSVGTAVPEPSSSFLLFSALLLLVGIRRDNSSPVVRNGRGYES